MDVIILPKELYFIIISYVDNISLINLCEVDYFRNLVLDNTKELFYFLSIGFKLDELCIDFTFRDVLYILDRITRLKLTVDYMQSFERDHPLLRNIFHFHDIRDYKNFYNLIKPIIDRGIIDNSNILNPQGYLDFYLDYNMFDNQFYLILEIWATDDIKIEMKYQEGLDMLFYLKYKRAIN